MSDTALHEIHRHRREVTTPAGPASCLDTGGEGPAAVFVHGVGTSSLLWRHVIAGLAQDRRCVAIDLPLHGHSPAAPRQDFSLPALARFVGGVCDALELDEIDLVANDTGGAVAQIVAAREPHRLRTLTLTNCETQGNVPPRAFRSTVFAARSGLLALTGPRLLRTLPEARRRVFGSGYQDVEHLPLQVVQAWLRPVLGSRAAGRQFQRWITSIRDRDLRTVEPALRELEVPTLIVWGTDDVFFHRRWADWLRATIPGAGDVVEVPGGRLFFPDERADELVAALRQHWRTPVS